MEGVLEVKTTNKMKKALGINDFLSLKFHDYPFTGEWLAAFGSPEKNFKMLIYGPEKNGKTDFTMKLCKYLGTFGKVYYNSSEEGRSKTMQETIRRNNMQEVAGRVLFLHKEDITTLMERLHRKGSPRFVVIDSLDYMELTDNDYKTLTDAFPRKAFIFICWSDPKDNPLLTSAKMIAKRVDIKVKVKQWVAYPTSRFSSELGGNKPLKFHDKTIPTPTSHNPVQTLF